AGNVCDQKRRQNLEAPKQRVTERTWLVYGQASGNDGRQSEKSRRLFWHHVWSNLGKRQRRRKLSPRCRTSSRNLFRACDGVKPLQVRIPSPLRSYTGNQAKVSGAGADLNAILANL